MCPRSQSHLLTDELDRAKRESLVHPTEPPGDPTVNTITPVGGDSGQSSWLQGLPVTALSRRERAVPVRIQIEDRLAAGEAVEIDFEHIEATQSFIDELIGILVLERGPDVLRQLRFRKCSPDMKAIISFVVSDRAAQHLRDPHFGSPRVRMGLDGL
jgi:hypothetical protein